MQLTLIVLGVLVGLSGVIAVSLVPHESAVERDTRTFLQAVAQDHR